MTPSPRLAGPVAERVPPTPCRWWRRCGLRSCWRPWRAAVLRTGSSRTRRGRRGPSRTETIWWRERSRRRRMGGGGRPHGQPRPDHAETPATRPCRSRLPRRQPPPRPSPPTPPVQPAWRTGYAFGRPLGTPYVSAWSRSTLSAFSGTAGWAVRGRVVVLNAAAVAADTRGVTDLLGQTGRRGVIEGCGHGTSFSRRCTGSLVVFDDGAVAFCTAGCKPSGTAEALARHRRFVPAAALAPAFACLIIDSAPLQPLAGRCQPRQERCERHSTDAGQRIPDQHVDGSCSTSTFPAPRSSSGEAALGPGASSDEAALGPGASSDEAAGPVEPVQHGS